MGKQWKQRQTLFLWAPKSDGDCSHEIKRGLLLGRKVLTNLDNIFKSRDITLPTKVPSSQGCGFSSSHVWMWGLDYRESWAPKNWCFWTVVLEKTLESLLDCKEIQPVHPEGNQCWIFFEKTDVEVKMLILWPPYVKNWLIWKDPDAGEDWGQEEKGTTEDEMVGWHYQLSGHEFELTLGVGDRQGGLACFSPWGCKELDMTEWLNWTELMGTADSLEKSLMLGKIEGRRRRRHQRMRWLDGITNAMHMNLGGLRQMVRDRDTWCTAVCVVAKCWTGLGNWTQQYILESGKYKKFEKNIEVSIFLLRKYYLFMCTYFRHQTHIHIYYTHNLYFHVLN